MRKIWILVIFVVGFMVSVSVVVYGANIEAILDSIDGTSGLSVKDSGSVEVANIDSDGNMVIKGGLRLDSGGVEYTTAEDLIVDGKVGIGTTGPTAVLHLKAGTATASTAPLKLTSGTLLTTPEAGAVEFLTDAFYGTITTGAARKTFAFTDSNITGTAANVTGTVAVVNGRTVTTTGSITGTGALTFTAAGTNQNVTLTPSGTGYTLLNGNVGIGTTGPAAKLDVNGTLNVSSSISVGGGTSVGDFVIGANEAVNHQLKLFTGLNNDAEIWFYPYGEYGFKMGNYGTSGAKIFKIKNNNNDVVLAIGPNTTTDVSLLGRLIVSGTGDTTIAGNVGIGTTGPNEKLDVTVGNIAISTAGKTLKVKEGTNACMGTAVLVGGTVTVSTTAVTASSRIFLTIQSSGGTVGSVYISARTAGTSFAITSTSGTDTSTVAWFIVEPAT